MAIGKIIPPPLKVMEVCDDLELGLSMILYLSAILKYKSSIPTNKNNNTI
jgi:hypothetical protein